MLGNKRGDENNLYNNNVYPEKWYDNKRWHDEQYEKEIVS